jgi:SpoVK/Ycf46/Vps4 family AAA+-type ATPase
MNIFENQSAIEFENRICKHDEYLTVYNAIKKLTQYQGRKAKGMLVTGAIGSGKTLLAHDFGSNELPADTSNPAVKSKPMIYVNVALYRSPNQVISAILEELGDINPFNGNLEKKVARVMCLLKKLGVKLIVIDEFHDLLPRSSIHPSSAVYRFLKGFLDTCEVPFLLIGINGTERILDVDKQLSSRFLPTQYLSEFTCKTKEEMVRFGLVIESLLEHFPRKTKGMQFVESTTLQDGTEDFDLIKNPSLLFRLTLATGGLMRCIMNLLTECIEITQPTDVVDSSVLKQAFENVIHTHLPGNPFDTYEYSLSKVKSQLAREGLYNA